MNASILLPDSIGPMLGWWTKAWNGIRRRGDAATPAQQAAFEAALDKPLPPLRMSVLDGLHHGALETFLTPRILIGSSAECDVILSDRGVLARHLELRHIDGRWCIQDLCSAAEVVLAPKRGGGGERMHVACGPVRLRFDVKAAAGHASERGGTHRTVVLAAATGIAFTAVLITAVYWERVWNTPSPVNLLAAGRTELARAGFGEVRVDPQPEGGLALAGFVADEAEATRLHAWQRGSLYREARQNVLVVSRLVDRLRQDLAADGVRLSYLGRGEFRAEGATRRMELKQRLREFSQALQGRVNVEDRVAYIEEVAKAPPRPRPLPFRIVNVMVGDPSYFQTDTGSRYFVGSVLQDGASVISIDAKSVVFKQGNTEVVYPLG